MAKQYKLSEGMFDKFWQLFSNKKTPKQLQSIIDKDPVLIKLQKQFDTINLSAGDYIRNLKKTNPKRYEELKNLGVIPD